MTDLLETVIEAHGGVEPHQAQVFRRTPDGQSLDEPLIVSIDLSEIAFT